MTIADWLTEKMQILGKAEVDSPRRDALVLLEDTLEKDRSWVLAHPEYGISEQELKKVNQLIERRTTREPLAYIRGKAWFYGRFFEVNPGVLIPRPESESFIDLLKGLSNLDPQHLTTVIDIGTGSGALAITAKLELPGIKVIATDIDNKALKVAQKNAKKHNVEIKLIKSDLLESLPISNFQRPTAVVANLPYVPDGLVTSPEINTEPKIALFSGKDGLDHYRKFWQQIRNLDSTPKYILIESLEKQHKDLEIIAQKSGYKLHKTEVLVQLFKLGE